MHDESIITDSTGISINTLIGAEILKSTSSDYQQTLIATPWHSMNSSSTLSEMTDQDTWLELGRTEWLIA